MLVTILIMLLADMYIHATEPQVKSSLSYAIRIYYDM